MKAQDRIGLREPGDIKMSTIHINHCTRKDRAKAEESAGKRTDWAGVSRRKPRLASPLDRGWGSYNLRSV